MGIIRKQSIIGSVYTYLGSLLGFLISGLLMPRILSVEQVGLIHILVAYATVISTFSALGITNITNRFFPYFKNSKKQHNGFFFLMILIPTIGFILSLILFPLIKTFALSKQHDLSYLLNDYFLYVIPLSFGLLFFKVFENYYKFLHNVILGVFLQEVLYRFLILIIITGFYLRLFPFSNFMKFYIMAIYVPLAIIAISLVHKKEFILTPRISLITKKLSKTMLNVGLYGIISSFSLIILLSIDKVMIEKLLGLDSVGIYSVAFFFGALISIPSRSLLKISSAYVSESLKNDDFKLIKEINYKSTLNQFIVGFLVFIGVWSNIHNVFKILPVEYEGGKWVIFFIGLAFLTDMIFRMSETILSQSKYYKYVTYIIIIFVAVVIITNIIFIPVWGITGAAVASFISKLFLCSLYLIVIYKKFKLFSLDHKLLIIIILGLIVYLINSFLPILDNYIVDIFYRSIIITLLYGTIVYFLKISEDINVVINGIFNKMIKRNL